MELQSTRLEYEVSDESGYEFRVVATKDGREGWSATVTMSANGYVTPEDAIARVVESAREFVRISTKEPAPAETP